MKNIDQDKLKKISKLYEEIRKKDVKPFLQRIREHDRLQRSIDKVALQLVGLEEWANRLDELYDAVQGELEAMLQVMKSSTKTKRKEKRLEAEEEKVEPLERWLT